MNKGDENPSESTLIDDGFKDIRKTIGDAIIKDNLKTGEIFKYLLHKQANQYDTYFHCYIDEVTKLKRIGDQLILFSAANI